MDIDKIRKEIMFRAEKTLYYSELVIEQCDSWLTAEEDNEAQNPAPTFPRRDRKNLHRGQGASDETFHQANLNHLLY